jgi:N-acetylmuramoyl-L-alanine amidase
MAQRWLLVGVLGVLAVPAPAYPVVERISFAAREDGAGYAVRFHASERFQAYSEPRLTADNRLELVLFDAELAGACRQDDPEGPVRAYALRPERGHLYVQLELDEGVRIEAVAYRERGSNDLILGLTYAPEPTPAGLVRPVALGTQAARAVAGTGGDLPPGDVRARWQLDTIVIDAGHGGQDTGAVGAGGLREKDVTLAVARKVGRALEAQLGVRVVYTRDDDYFVTLKDRGHIANRAGGKLFVSIHANAAENSGGSGTETFFLGMHKTEAARHVMDRENSVIRYESDTDHYDTLDQQALIVQTLAQSAYMRNSEELAELIQAQFTDGVGRKNRGVKQAGFYVLWSASMPAVLVELGFVTNPQEAAFLRGEAGQDELASAIFRAVRAFKTQYEKGLDLVVRQ